MFLDDNFLLTTQAARTLYHQVAKQQPIIDYHCHIDPKMIRDDYHFSDISEAWLGGDHYKWRIMRAAGIAEEFITGAGEGRAKLRAYAKALNLAIGNPLYAWTHLELKRYFDCELLLKEDTADAIYDICTKKLAQEDMGVRGLIRQSGVKLICTTDDPIDSLEHHKFLKEDASWEVPVLPAWRPDKLLNIEQAGFGKYIARLADVSAMAINSVETLKQAIDKRMDYFDAMGCCVSDHGFVVIPYVPYTQEEIEAILQSALSGQNIEVNDALKFRTAMLTYLAGQYARRGWVMQLHYGALRNVNSAMYERLGPDTGYDAIAQTNCSDNLAKLLNAIRLKGDMPKTIVYSLNDNDNRAIATILGGFQDDKARLTLGAAWWFNDTRLGMQKQMQDLADVSLLGNFLGMLTDSRSFLSYTRHEYFRRVLCNMIGQWAELGECPDDEELLSNLVANICYGNTRTFFGFDKLIG